MSLYPSFEIAAHDLSTLGFHPLGIAVEGVTTRAYWLSLTLHRIAEGHPILGEDRYQVSYSDASTNLLSALYMVRRTQYPEWTPAQCQEDAQHWVELLGYAPALPHAA